jgi:hypothetical protein
MQNTWAQKANKRTILNKMKIVTFLHLVFLSLSTLNACICLRTQFDKEANKADIIFSGTVTSIHENCNSAIPVCVSVTVNKCWKGNIENEINIYTGFGGGDCGFNFDVNKEYLIFANSEHITTSCHRTVLVEESHDIYNLMEKFENIPLIDTLGNLNNYATSFLKNTLHINENITFNNDVLIISNRDIINWHELFQKDIHNIQNLKYYCLPDNFVRKYNLKSNQILVDTIYDYYKKSDKTIIRKVKNIISKKVKKKEI